MANKIPDLRSILNDLAAHARAEGERALGRLADDVSKDFRAQLKAQDFKAFGANPLNPKYLQWKRRKKLDPRIMIRTGHYLAAIKPQAPVKKGRAIGIRIGFLPTDRAVHWKTRRPIAYTLNALAMAQEFGTETIPARPHWRPYFAKLERLAAAHARRMGKEIAATYHLRPHYR